MALCGCCRYEIELALFGGDESGNLDAGAVPTFRKSFPGPRMSFMAAGLLNESLLGPTRTISP